MPENSKKVETVEIHYICDECQLGEMLPTGKAYLTYPARFEHKCNNCGAITRFVGETYPRTEYHEID